MKLKDTGKKYVDVLEDLEEAYEQEQEFWRNVEKYILHGVKGKDEKGHWVEIRCRVRPIQMDLITAVREKHPPGKYKSQAQLVRSLLSTGTYTHFEYFKRTKSMKFKAEEEILTSLNVLGRKHRLDELRKDIRKAMNITVNGSDSSEEKSKVIDLLGKIEQKIANL